MLTNYVDDKLDRTKPPIAGIPKDLKFPEHYETVIPNGITVLVIENYKIPAVSVRLVFKNAGASYDGPKYGLAALTADLLTKGTKNRTALQIAEEIDYLGASLSAGTDWDGSYISLSCLKKHLGKASDVLADVVLNPAFDDKEINRVKKQRISSIIQGKDDTNILADKLFNKVVFDSHPYAYPLEGTESSVSFMHASDIKDFYTQYYRPGNLILAFVGAISADEAIGIVNEKFSAWVNNNNAGLNHSGNFISGYPTDNIFIADKPGAVQSSLRIGHIGIERNNPDFLAVTVLNTILGGFFGSRINYILREVHGYTYGARSSFNARIEKGDFSVDTEVRTEVSYDAVKLIIKELKNITESPVTGDELQLVKNYLTGIFPLQLETANAVASRVINLKLYGLPEDFYNNYISDINNFSAVDLLNTAQKYIYPEKCYIALSGDANKIKNDFSQLGNVQVFNADIEHVNNK